MDFLTPGMALAIVDAFATFKERGVIPKTITWPKARPFGGIFALVVGLAVVDPVAKFKQRIVIHSRNIDRGLKFQKNDHVTQTMPLSGEIFTPGMRLAVVDPLAKFKEWNIQGGLKF